MTALGGTEDLLKIRENYGLLFHAEEAVLYAQRTRLEKYFSYQEPPAPPPQKALR